MHGGRGSTRGSTLKGAAQETSHETAREVVICRGQRMMRHVAPTADRELLPACYVGQGVEGLLIASREGLTIRHARVVDERC